VEFTDYVHSTTYTPEAFDPRLTAAVERTVFDDGSDAHASAPVTPVRSVRASDDAQLVAAKASELIDAVPTSVDFMLELLSLFGGWDLVSGEQASAAVPAADAMFRLKVLATVRQLAQGWSSGSASRVPPKVRTPVQSTSSQGTRASAPIA
jgi:hypothetical protein